MTAFAVAFSYVSANALWYQPHVHSGAFFATRSAPEPALGQPGDEEADRSTASIESDEPPERDTVIRLEQEQPIPPRRPASREREAAAQPSGVPERVSEEQAAPPERRTASTEEDRVRVVQTMLAELDLYDDEIDGLNGPNTRQAIEAYQEMVGLTVTGGIDDDLLEELGRSDLVVQDDGGEEDVVARDRDDERQVAQAQAELQRQTDSIETASSQAQPEGLERRVRAGLKAFGNDGIAIDGPMDDRTRSAIVEFQSLFGLETDGRPSAEVYAKMQEIGLIN